MPACKYLYLLIWEIIKEKKLTHKMKTLLLYVSINVMFHIKVENTKPKHASDTISWNKAVKKEQILRVELYVR